jgi:phytoene synthase
VSSLEAAYACCARLAAGHDENFPVASRLLPARMRPGVAAVYAFARVADDIADEGSVPPEIREERLTRWHARLRGASVPSGAIDSADEELMFVALRDTIDRSKLPVWLFDDLVSAFRQDITTSRYATWRDLLEYCRRSADPVGRLVLRIAGRNDPRLDLSSDCLCTALQLTNFWQDLARDWQKGRVYVPTEDLARYGATEAALADGALDPAWRRLIDVLAARTALLFEGGRTVCGAVGGRLGLELKATWLGGRRVLSRVTRNDFDPFRRRPALSALDAPALIWGLVTW